jgi:hypothetical protein
VDAGPDALSGNDQGAAAADPPVDAQWLGCAESDIPPKTRRRSMSGSI